MAVGRASTVPIRRLECPEFIYAVAIQLCVIAAQCAY
jgi:hypothetical protein